MFRTFPYETHDSHAGQPPDLETDAAMRPIYLYHRLQPTKVPLDGSFTLRWFLLHTPKASPEQNQASARHTCNSSARRGGGRICPREV